MADTEKKTAPKKAAPGTREYDRETGRFLDGPHPEDYEDEPVAEQKDSAKEEK